MTTDVVVVVLAVCAGGILLVLVLGLTSWAHRAPRADRAGVPGGAGRPDATGEPGPRPEVPEPGGLPHGTSPQGGPEPDEPPDPDGEPEPTAAMPRERARVLAAHASAAEGRAGRAVAEAEAARAEYDGAEARRAAIEAEYDEARLAYAEALRAVRAGRPEPPSEEERSRRREVESAALAAYRRGELSIDELRAVFARAGDRGAEQEALGHRAERLAARESEVRRRYDLAVATARVAGERLHIAEVAAAATTQEAVDAAMEAQVAADELEQADRGPW